LEIEISPGMLDKAMAALERIPSLQVQRGADNLLQVTGLTRTGVPDLIKHLIQADVDIYRVQPDEVTLEDVYFALHSDNHMELPE
jgi:ABC-2 type transport system ATP-binding protein